jgi:branched-chain amino acid transport system substrate-binding protein
MRRLTVALAGSLAVFAGAPASAQVSNAPIKVGAISSMALFPEATAAVKAYFDRVNAGGGIQGRPLVLLVQDDGADPAQAADAARQLVETQGVVAHVGSASALDCAVNAAYYERQGLVSIQGTGVDPACFSSPSISPVNAGPYVSAALALQFLVEVRRRERLCVYATSYAAAQTAAFNQEIDAWLAAARRRLVDSAIGMAPTDDLAARVAQAVAAGCDGVVYVGVQAHAVQWLTAVSAGRSGGIDWVFLTPAYTAALAARFASLDAQVFAMSEFEPWSSRSGLLSDWREAMDRGKVPRSSLSQGGYVAALAFVRALRGIHGEINRASVTQALKALPPQRVSMMGTAWEFGPGRTHSSNRANVPVQLVGGRWVIAHGDYITLPKAAEKK